MNMTDMNTTNRTNQVLSRPEINEHLLDENYHYIDQTGGNFLKDSVHYARKYYCPTLTNLKAGLISILPILDWLPKYRIREYLLLDFVGGLAVGFVQIPQGLAYSLVGNFPAVNGLYVTFFTVMVYFLLGTINHLSLGTYAIITLLTQQAVDSFDGVLFDSTGKLPVSSNFINTNYVQARVTIATAIAFLVGMFQIGCGILRLGVISKYMSDVIVDAIIIGGAFHILVSQINQLLGIALTTVESHFTIYINLMQIFTRLNQVNPATVIIALVSMLTIFLVKHQISHRFKKQLPAPIPIEFLIVIFGTLISYLANFNGMWNVKILGNIPSGFPAPVLPPVSLWSQVALSALNICFVSFVINLSLGKLFAKKFNYTFEANQEFFAYGAGNMVSALFGGFPSDVGLSRSVILVGTGAKTQIFALVSSCIVLPVLLGAGVLLKCLPIACLASIITVAILTYIRELRNIIPHYKHSKLEALSWIVTLVVILVTDVDIGIYAGMGFNVLLFYVQTQKPLTTVLGNIPHTDIYDTIGTCEMAKEIQTIKIIRFEASLIFSSVDNFKYQVYKLSKVNPVKVLEEIENKKREHKRVLARLNAKSKKFIKQFNSTGQLNPAYHENEADNTEWKGHLRNEINQIVSVLPIRHIILDCSCINIIDTNGVDALVKLCQMYNEIGITMHLTYCKRSVISTLDRHEFSKKFSYELIYPTTHDAVAFIFRRATQGISVNHPKIKKLDRAKDEISDTEDNIVLPIYRNRGIYSNYVFENVLNDNALYHNDLDLMRSRIVNNPYLPR